LPTTRIFRLLNFELFARPRKSVYLLGSAAFVGLFGYLIYENLRWAEENEEEIERALRTRSRRRRAH
jgi:Domain of unknown function (DUF4500)